MVFIIYFYLNEQGTNVINETIYFDFLSYFFLI